MNIYVFTSYTSAVNVRVTVHTQYRQQNSAFTADLYVCSLICKFITDLFNVFTFEIYYTFLHSTIIHSFIHFHLFFRSFSAYVYITQYYILYINTHYKLHGSLVTWIWYRVSKIYIRRERQSFLRA